MSGEGTEQVHPGYSPDKVFFSCKLVMMEREQRFLLHFFSSLSA